jgi:hypothetical protein
MGHFILKYLIVIGVVLLGFQPNAFADEKDKDKKKDVKTVTQKDSIKIKVNLDVQSDDTLVFDDFDEDDDDDKGDNSTIATVVTPFKLKTCIMPMRHPETITIIECPSLVITPSAIKLDTLPTADHNISIDPPEMSVYPNPASATNQEIHVTHNITGTTKVMVYTLSGQVIQNITVSDNAVTLHGLATGLYIVHVSGDNQSTSKRLLVQ